MITLVEPWRRFLMIQSNLFNNPLWSYYSLGWLRTSYWLLQLLVPPLFGTQLLPMICPRWRGDLSSMPWLCKFLRSGLSLAHWESGRDVGNVRTETAPLRNKIGSSRHGCKLISRVEWQSIITFQSEINNTLPRNPDIRYADLGWPIAIKWKCYRNKKRLVKKQFCSPLPPPQLPQF